MRRLGENGFDESFAAEVQMPTWDPMKNQAFPSKYWTGPGEYAAENLDGDDSRVIMDRAIPFIRGAARTMISPSSAVIWFHAPHAPVVAGPRHRKMYSGVQRRRATFLRLHHGPRRAGGAIAHGAARPRRGGQHDVLVLQRQWARGPDAP